MSNLALCRAWDRAARNERLLLLRSFTHDNYYGEANMLIFARLNILLQFCFTDSLCFRVMSCVL